MPFNYSITFGFTPSICAGTVNIAKLLIAHGANVNEKGFNGDSPLHIAAMNGKNFIAKCTVGTVKLSCNDRIIGQKNSNDFEK